MTHSQRKSETQMLTTANKESTQFINSLKQAGIEISNEREVIERLE